MPRLSGRKTGEDSGDVCGCGRYPCAGMRGSAPADGRLLGLVDLRLNESSLPGSPRKGKRKSAYLKKRGCSLASRTNMIFPAPRLPEYGVAVVTAVGMESELGQIAGLDEYDRREENASLEIEPEQFSGRFAIGIPGGLRDCILAGSLPRRVAVKAAVMFAVALLWRQSRSGLGSIATIVQAMGTQKMAREHAIIKDLKGGGKSGLRVGDLHG